MLSLNPDSVCFKVFPESNVCSLFFFFNSAARSMLWRGRPLEPMWSAWTKEIRLYCGLNFDLKAPELACQKPAWEGNGLCLDRTGSPKSSSSLQPSAESASLALGKNSQCNN